MSKSDVLEITDLIANLRREREQPGSTDLPNYLSASDLHGNASRLAEILETARREGISKTFLVGDIYAGEGGWQAYQLLKPLVGEGADGDIVPMWGNHELAFVLGMLGSDRQLRFFYGFGGRQLIQEMNAELRPRGEPLVVFTGSGSPNEDDLAAIRNHPRLQEMSRWIQKTHRLFATDLYGTGYLHACPKINQQGFHVQYDGKVGIEAIKRIEEDLMVADRFDHPVFSPLLRTDSSPLWALHEITSAKQFDEACHPQGVRQLIFGHLHRADPVNVGGFNRQIGIAVDFDQGLGGYLIIGPSGLTFYKFAESNNHNTVATQVIVSPQGVSAADTFSYDVEEFLVRKLIAAEKNIYDNLPTVSRQAESEFDRLQQLHDKGYPFIQRVFAELYSHVKDLTLRKKMFSAAVDSCDEEAFKSFIHFLFAKTRELESYGSDWYSDEYLAAKADVEVLLQALRDMPVKRLGLFDAKLRGTTSRINLLELYTQILHLQDPDLAVMAIENLAALDHWTADQELRRAFFHDVRKVRVCAAEALAHRGLVAYPLVTSLLISRDIWVRFLALWTVAEIGQSNEIQAQAISDIRNALADEQDWLICTVGKELLRMLGDANVADFAEPTDIPNLTNEVIETLQCIVDTQQEPHRKAFKIYFITVSISSLVYRRGLIGLDIDELKIYVNKEDFFPPHYRFYKSGDRDRDGQWQGWRRLWIRGETFNQLDGPKIIEMSSAEIDTLPTDRETVVLFDHRDGDARVKIPDFDAVVDEFGLGKLKDQIRHHLMHNWNSYTDAEKALLCRLHAAAAVTMLFHLPAEIFVSQAEATQLENLAAKPWDESEQRRKPLISFEEPTQTSVKSQRAKQTLVARCNWIDAVKYPVHVYLIG